MAITFRKYQELFTGTSRFTANTRMCLERAIGHALFGRKGATVPLRSAVSHATRELRVQGLGDAAILTTLGSIVEGAGRACGANRTSLLSGIPLWCSVHTRVLASAEHELSRLSVNAVA
jgi:hypothetical protein